jgi:anti-sigma factor RsiW
MRVPKRDSLVPPHLSDPQIVAYVDGELARLEMDVARAHLESCWSCRSRMGEVQGQIDGFLRARPILMPKPPAFSENRVEQFRQRLARHASESESVGLSFQGQITNWGSRVRDTFASLSQYRRAIIAIAVSACLLIVMFSDVLNTRVSADTVLRHAEDFQTSQLPHAGQVTRMSVRIDKFERGSTVAKQLGTVTLVRDSMGAATYVNAQSVSGGSHAAMFKDAARISEPVLVLGTVMSDGGVNPALAHFLTEKAWVPDLSVGQFRRLVETRGEGQVTARRNHGVFELHYPFAPGNPSGISETLLRVDATSYAMTSLSIFTTETNGGDEYRFTRASFSFEPRTVEMAAMFEPVESTGLPAAPARQLPQIAKPVPLSYGNSLATDAEVSLAEALHHLDSCLGEEVYVFPMSDGSLLVQGLVDNAARRDAIRQSLRAVGGSFRVEIYIPREVKSSSELYRSPDQPAELAAPAHNSAPDTLADLSGTSVPLHDLLYQHFFKPGASQEDTNKQVALFSDEVVTLARQTFLHAWALKRLDREFSAQRSRNLSPEFLRTVAHMQEDHRHWISTIANRQAEMLGPLAGQDATARAAEIANTPDSDTLLRLAQEQNDLVRALFTISPQTPATASGLSRLVAVLKQMGT